MKVDTNGKDYIAGGKVWKPGEDGLVEISDTVARAEGLIDQDDDGKIDPYERIAALEARVTELEAENAELLAKVDPPTAEKDELVRRGLELGIECESKLKRWSVPRLQEAIAEAKKSEA